MWNMIPSFAPYVQYFQPVFTNPSYATCTVLAFGWLMCLGPANLLRVFRSSGSRPGLHDFKKRHGYDSEYNFFERSSWCPTELCKRLVLFVIDKLQLTGPVYLIVDDTLVHKRGLKVWGLGWFRDAVASTSKRVATASGHNWVTLAIAYRLPCGLVLSLPIMACLHRVGEGLPSAAKLARSMITDLEKMFPDRRFVLLGDGGYTNGVLLKDLPALGVKVEYIGRLRADATLFDPNVPEQPKGKRGRKPGKGPKLPKLKEIAKSASKPGKQGGEYQFQEAKTKVAGKERIVWVCNFVALWPEVLGDKAGLFLIIRVPNTKLKDMMVMSTNVEESIENILTYYSWRWSIEVMYKASKQVLDIEGPQHYRQSSVEKVAPWVWWLQTVLTVWYVLDGKNLPEAMEIKTRMGEWDTEWSLANMVRVFRRATINQEISACSGSEAKTLEFVERLKDWVHLAA